MPDASDRFNQAGVPPDTERLLIAAAAGLPGSVDDLFLRHRERLLAIIRARMDGRLRRRVDPSDVIQETWITAAAGLKDYLEQRPIRFYPWLRAIALQRLTDLHRKHVRATGNSVLREVDAGLTVSESGWESLAVSVADSRLRPDRHASIKEQTRQVRLAIAQLSQPDQQVIVLRHIEGLSVAEIAEVLGIPAGTVKSRHFRSLLKLQTHLRDFQ